MREKSRRSFVKLGTVGLSAGALAAGALALNPQRAAAQARPASLLRRVLDRGKVLVGTGSTNAPWHFEDDRGTLTGMDVAMARIVAKGLFDDETKIEFTRQDAAQRIPNIVTGKVDITIQFMTVTPQRAQLVAFTRPYFLEQMALMTRADASTSFEALLAAGNRTRISILQNVDAESLIRKVLPQAQVLQLDTLGNVVQALEARRVEAASLSLSAVRYLSRRNPGRYADAGKTWYGQLYSAAVPQGDPDWLNFVNTAFDVAIFGHQSDIYDGALREYFGLQLPDRPPGLPPF
jgi:polar amino acid transport system substrate-binding protein